MISPIQGLSLRPLHLLIQSQVDEMTGEQPAVTSAPLKDDSLSSLIRMLAEPGFMGQMTKLLQYASQHQPPSTFEGGSSTTGAPTAPSEDDESKDDEDSQFGMLQRAPTRRGSSLPLPLLDGHTLTPWISLRGNTLRWEGTQTLSCTLGV